MKFRLAAVLILITVFLTACNFTLASDITPPPDYKSPTPAPTLGALFPAEPPAPQEVLALYMEKCAPCHGEAGRGDGPQGMQLSVKIPAFGLPAVGRAAIPSNYFTMVSQGRIENFMPPFSGSLNEQQRWDIVAYALSLHTSEDELALGKTLYENNCATCHGADGSADIKANLSDQQFMAKRSEQDLFNAMTEGVQGVMPAFDKLTEDERWALGAYVRSLTFAQAQAAAALQASPTAAATSTPAAVTPEGTSSPASTAAATPEGTPIPASTAESTPQPSLEATPVSTVLPNTTGAVTGSVANASGGALPEGLTVTLLGFNHGQDNTAPEQVLDLTTDVKADGSYAFENVEIPEGRFFTAQVDYQGISYKSDIAVIANGATGLSIPPITVYETTDDLTNLKVNQGHLIVQFDESRIGIIEIFVINNFGDKTVVFTADGQTLPFAPMPEGVEILGYDLQLGEAQFIQTTDGFGVPPSDKQYAVSASFAMPYDKSADITVPLGIAIPVLNLIAPEGVKITSDQLASQSADPQSQSQVFTSGPFNSGDQLSFNVSGAPITESAPATSVNTNTGVLIGIGALGLVLIVAGVFLFLRDRKQRREKVDDAYDEPVNETAEEIMDAIIALDDQYRAGNISEEVYRQRRADLKTRLKSTL
jgi:mono/diheme cytochrome c family protein